MKRLLMLAILLVLMTPAAYAVALAEDIATTIKLRGFDCGGRQVSNINQSQDTQGNKTIQATCPNGIRYQVHVSATGRVSVKRVN